MKTSIQIIPVTEIERTDFSVKYQAENFEYNLNWETGGKAGGEYFNTYNGHLIIKDKKFSLYLHWSHDGNIGIYEFGTRNLLGEISWQKRENSTLIIKWNE